MKYIITLLSIICSISVFSQKQIPMESWRTHFSYKWSTIISQSHEKVYSVTNDGSLFSVGKDDRLVEAYSKISGLSDNNIVNIRYCNNTNLLVIAYDNANIDLMDDYGDIYNIPDIYNKNTGSSKKINDIHIHNSIAYLACDFGIVAIDLKRKEIRDTYIIGDNATYITLNSVAISNDTIYSASENKIFYANLKDNLVNFQNWQSFSVDFPELIKKISVAKSTLYALSENKILYQFKYNVWNNIHTNISSMNVNNNELWFVEDTEPLQTIRNISGTFSFGAVIPCIVENDLEDENVLWFAEARGIGKYYHHLEAAEYFKPSGPTSKFAWRIKYSGGRMYVIPGGRWASEYQRDGSVMVYDNGKWINFIYSDFKQFTDYNVIDFVDIAVNPNDNTHFYVASYGSGMFEVRNDKVVKHYTAHNSDIETIFPLEPPTSNSFNLYQRIDGLRFDNDGNLWLLNSGVNYPIKYMQPNGQFIKMAHSEISEFGTLQDILIDNKDENLKLVLAPRSYNSTSTALFAFNDNGTPSVFDDQRQLHSKFIDQDDKLFNPTNFHCMAQEKDGTLWVGTTTGVAVINNTKKLLTNSLSVNRIKIPRNDGTGLADYLLGTERINDIAIDGANRKWFATENSGVYLTSADGLETIHHFTKKNSPLLSDNVLCIGINEQTGEVFFGTSNGIISFQSDSKEPSADFENIHAYPNPVRPDYLGPVSITGLMDETVVRITDVNGNVIYETISNGGIAVWNGNLKDGTRAATGVYFALCVQKNGKKYERTKILFINN